VKIDGVRGAPIDRIALDEFFDGPTHVDIRVISPYGRAMLREISMGSFEVGGVDTKGRASDIKTNVAGTAEREIRARDIKLQYTFAGTNIMSDGVLAEWNKELWTALDEMDPRILGTVIDAIDKQSKFAIEEKDADPT
jgi:hypothetical protein